MVYRYLFEAFPQSVTFSVYLYIYLGLQCLSVQPRSSGGLWASPGPGIELIDLCTVKWILSYWATRELQGGRL